MQQDGWKTQDSRMTKKCHARPGMHIFFRCSAVVSLPAIQLGRLSNNFPVRNTSLEPVLMQRYVFFI